jgi:ABC-type multidrug transport system ATPase subunit
MGPSGCGKTTLLNILSRRLKESSIMGTQLLAGVDVDDATLRALSTYVEQEDHLIGALTVRETIEFAAKLALPSSVSGRERRQRAEHMMKDFGLWGVKDNKIGTPLQRGVSGGQKRRVTTAAQLITLPKVIFLGIEQIFTIELTIYLDEPTSGLDSTASYEIISCLRNTALSYEVCTIFSIAYVATDDCYRFNSSTLDEYPYALR